MKKILGLALGLTMIALTPAVGNAADTINVKAQIKEKKIDGNRFCTRLGIKNNEIKFTDVAFGKINFIKLDIWGILLLNKDGEEAEFILDSKNILQPELDPNAKILKGESASGWVCWKLPSNTWKPATIVLKNNTMGKRWAKISVSR
jgi:hypothetical protein